MCYYYYYLNNDRYYFKSSLSSPAPSPWFPAHPRPSPSSLCPQARSLVNLVRPPSFPLRFDYWLIIVLFSIGAARTSCWPPAPRTYVSDQKQYVFADKSQKKFLQAPKLLCWEVNKCGGSWRACAVEEPAGRGHGRLNQGRGRAGAGSSLKRSRVWAAVPAR